MLIYKILRTGEWAEFDSSGVFDGSPDDNRDGFIHCSSRVQLPATAARFFADEAGLVVAVMDAAAIGGFVRWEPGGNGDLYPHVYRPLTLDDVVAVHEVSGAAEVEAGVPRD